MAKIKVNIGTSAVPNYVYLDANNADSVTWSGINNKPTTLDGYGITDATASSQIGSLLNLQTTNKTNVVNAVNELFTNVSNGKNSIASAIAGMGQTASGSDTFAQLTTKIGNISKDANATTGQILSGQTAYVNGIKTTGTMPNNSAIVIAPGAANTTIAAGYHNGAGIVQGDVDLVPGNIAQGVNIFGVVGNILPAAGTAVAADVLTGKTFSTGAGAGIAGNMANQGSPTFPATGANQAIPAGFYSGGTVKGFSIQRVTTANVNGVRSQFNADIFRWTVTLPYTGIITGFTFLSNSLMSYPDGKIKPHGGALINAAGAWDYPQQSISNVALNSQVTVDITPITANGATLTFVVESAGSGAYAGLSASNTLDIPFSVTVSSIISL